MDKVSGGKKLKGVKTVDSQRSKSTHILPKFEQFEKKIRKMSFENINFFDSKIIDSQAKAGESMSQNLKIS